MIRFEPVDEPADFDLRARVPGEAWLAANPGNARPRDYWTQFNSDLAEGFRNLCAYSAMILGSGGTVDHFVSCHEDRSKAYEWDNYRYCAHWVNSCKGTEPAGNLLDPFEVEDGWFELQLPSLQLTVTDAVPPELRGRAEYVLKRLRLRNGQRVIRQRRMWYGMYQRGMIAKEGLREVAPLIAAALERREGAQPLDGP